MKNRVKRTPLNKLFVVFCSLLCSFTLFAQQNPNLSRIKLKSLILKERFAEATETLRKIGKDPQLSETERIYYYLMKSDYFIATNRTDSSGRYLQLAKKSIKPQMPDSLIAQLDFELGSWYITIPDYENSYNSYKSSMNLYEKAEDMDSYIKAAGNFGILSFLQGDTTTALHTFQKILKRSEQKGEALNCAIVHQNLGRFFVSIGELDSAVFHFRASIGTEKTPKKTNFVANSFRGLAEVAHLKNQLPEAIENYQKSIAIYKELRLKGELINAITGIKAIYKASGNIDKALEYSEILNELRSELYEENRAKSIGVTQAELKDIEKTAEIRLLSSGLELEKSKTWFLLSAGIFVLIVLIFVYLKWKDQRKQRALEHETYTHKEQINQLENDKLRNELEMREKALTAESLRLIEKNEQTQLLREKISELSKRLPEKYANELNSLTIAFRSLLRVEHSWEEFLLYFKEIHPDAHRVFDGLKPTLTLKEKRLLSLIYLELNTKEISKIAGISPDSVKKARTRLRKKLSLDESDSIRIFVTDLMLAG